jgi:heme-degrading monooxygenase HmoA
MFAQVFSFECDPAQAESMLQFFKKVVAPDLQRQPGFQGVQNLTNSESGHWLGISYWGSEAEARTAAERAMNPPPPPPVVSAPAIRNYSAQVYEVMM